MKPGTCTILAPALPDSLSAPPPPVVKSETITFTPIGVVHTPHKVLTMLPYDGHGVPGVIELKPELAAGLTGMGEYSRIYCLWYFHRSPREYQLVGDHPLFLGSKVGVFTCQSPLRPNLIALTLLKLIKVEGSQVSQLFSFSVSDFLSSQFSLQ